MGKDGQKDGVAGTGANNRAGKLHRAEEKSIGRPELKQ